MTVHLRGRHSITKTILVTCTNPYAADRLRLREAYLRVQHSANAEMSAGTDPYMRSRTPDDSIRYQSTIYALVRVLDKVVLLARTVRIFGSWHTDFKKKTSVG